MADNQKKTYTIQDVRNAIAKDNAKLLCDILLTSGIDVNVNYEDNGNTPLMQAISKYSSSYYSCNCLMVEILLKFGADPNLKNNIDITKSPVYMTKCKRELINLLIRYGVNLEGEHYNGDSLLFHTFKYRDYQFAISLLNAGAKKEEVYINQTRFFNYKPGDKEQVDKFFEECDYYDNILNSSRIKGAKK